jgi:hypothetical protein
LITIGTRTQTLFLAAFKRMPVPDKTSAEAIDHYAVGLFEPQPLCATLPKRTPFLPATTVGSVNFSARGSLKLLAHEGPLSDESRSTTLETSVSSKSATSRVRAHAT